LICWTDMESCSYIYILNYQASTFKFGYYTILPSEFVRNVLYNAVGQLALGDCRHLDSERWRLGGPDHCVQPWDPRNWCKRHSCFVLFIPPVLGPFLSHAPIWGGLLTTLRYTRRPLVRLIVSFVVLVIGPPQNRKTVLPTCCAT